MLVEKKELMINGTAHSTMEQHTLNNSTIIENSVNGLRTRDNDHDLDDDDLDNDEENIVIDMADEDDDDEDDEDDEDDDDDAGYQESNLQNCNPHNQPLNHNNNKVKQESKAAINVVDNNNKSSANEANNNNNNHGHQFKVGDLVWFDPNQLGYSIPGKVIDYYQDLTLLTVKGYAQPLGDEENIEEHNKQLISADQTLQVYDLSDPIQFKSLKLRLPLTNESGLNDLIELEECSLESVIWNLKLRYKQGLIYTNCGSKILISVNPFKQLNNIYNLDQVNKYDTTNSANLITLTDYSNKLNTNLIRWLLLNDNPKQQKELLHNKTNHKDVDAKSHHHHQQPHIFAIANEALKRLLISGQDQCFILLGESGSGKTEASKLLIQYLATVNKSPTNLMTEQILESIQVLESFGNAKTILNDNSSRFGKLLEIRFNLLNGFINDAKTIDLNLLDRSRIVSQSENERNYNIFYELLAGLSVAEKEKYGLQSAEKYFYLNQGHCVELANKEDGDDFRSLLASMQVLGFNYEEQDTIFRLLASVLHLGNIYFHRKVLAIRSNKLAQQQQKLISSDNNNLLLDNKTSSSSAPSATAGVEGVEIGSDTEVRWVSHLLQIQFDSIMRCLTVRTTETSSIGAVPVGSCNQQQQQQPVVVVDRIVTPLNIDQALDTRDAIARALYTCLFKWLVQRINAMINNNTNSAGDSSYSKPEEEGDNANYSRPTKKEAIYLCQTSESLCEFQPDKLNQHHSNSASSRQSSLIRNKTTGKSRDSVRNLKSATISILDAFGFENLSENNFEQLCINYAAELLHYHTMKYLVRLEQAEYVRERLRWRPIQDFNQLDYTLNNNNIQQSTIDQAFSDNGLLVNNKSLVGTSSSPHNNPASIVNLISKKPLGILALLDDECNFPKASDQSFVEKCNHNHTLNENYQRSRLAPGASNQEFGIRHFNQTNRLVWYQVDGFIEKNKDSLRGDIFDLLISSKMSIVTDMLRKLHQNQHGNSNGDSFNNQKTLTRTYDGRYVSMKPRATSVASKFQDSLHNNRALESINYATSSSNTSTLNNNKLESSHYSTQQQQQQQLLSHYHVPASSANNNSINKPAPWFIICLKPNRSKTDEIFDVAYIQEQLRSMNLLELVQMRKFGYPIRMRYGEFVRRYKCLVPQKFLNNLTSCKNIQAANQRLLSSASSKQSKSNNSNSATKNGSSEIKRAIRDVCSAIVEYRFKQKTTTTTKESKQTTHSLNTFDSFDTIESLYQCGLTKMFLNERLYHVIEQMRLIEHQKAILFIQKTLRMWLVRREFLLKRQAAIVIQTQVRAYLCRQKFWHQYVSIVTLQRYWRQHLIKKRRKMLEAKRRAQRLQQQHQLQELQSQQRKQANQFRHRLQPNQIQTNNIKTTSKVGLDIPDDLAQLYRIQRNWRPKHELIHLNETNLNDKDELNIICSNFYEASEKILSELEENDKYDLKNFINKYYTVESPQFGYSRLPITREFCNFSKCYKKLTASGCCFDYNNSNRMRSNSSRANKAVRLKFATIKAISIYKLILRYIDSDLEQSSQLEQQQELVMQKLIKFKLISDYVIYQCLVVEPLLRDEIYLQLASQSWQNSKHKSVENVWKFMINCLNCFYPNDKELCKYLLKYASDCCVEKYKKIVVNKLCESIIVNNDRAKSIKENNYSRQFPPTMLEYWSNQEAIDRIALKASCYIEQHAPVIDSTADKLHKDEDLQDENETTKLVQINPHTTGEQLAKHVLRGLNVPEVNLSGWSADIQHKGNQNEPHLFDCRIRGDNQLLNHLSSIEMLPEFIELIDMANESLISSLIKEETKSKNRSQKLGPTIIGDNYHHNQPLSLNYHENNNKELPINYDESTNANIPINRQHHRHSIISQHSSSNFGRVSSELDLTRLSHTSKLNRRYIQDLGNQQRSYYYKHNNKTNYNYPADADEDPSYAANAASVSGRGFISPNSGEEGARLSINSKYSHRRSMSMQELQLASSALNGRYFNQLPPPHSIVANSNHYASSYVPQQALLSGHPNQPNHQSSGKRRSQTPNSFSMTNQRANRMSSSAYGSESYGHSSSFYAMTDDGLGAYSTANGMLADYQQPNRLHYLHQNRTSRLSKHSSGSLTRTTSGAAGARMAGSGGSRTSSSNSGHAAARQPRRSSSSSSRAGVSQLYTTQQQQHPPIPSQMHFNSADYERVGFVGQQSQFMAQNSSPYGMARNNIKPSNLMAEQYSRLPGTSRMGGANHQQFNLPTEAARKHYGHQAGGFMETKKQAAQLDPYQTKQFHYQLPKDSNVANGHYGPHSSAMSDTSEAPSLASHVRRVKVPQNNKDLDQYLDDLFNPLLDDTELDEMSDARSLATSIRGIQDEDEHHQDDLDNLCDPKTLSRIIRGLGDNEKDGESENENENENKQEDQKKRKETLSPTFETLLNSLKKNTCQEDGSLLLKEEQRTLDSNEQQAANNQPTTTIMADLNNMNLSELKALNEKLENEIQVAQSKRPSLEIISGQGSGPSLIPAPPPQPNLNNQSPLEDIYDRAKTVRIGKWRWPPPREESLANADDDNKDGASSNARNSSSEAQILNYYEAQERKRQSLISNSSSEHSKELYTTSLANNNSNLKTESECSNYSNKELELTTQSSNQDNLNATGEQGETTSPEEQASDAKEKAIVSTTLFAAAAANNNNNSSYVGKLKISSEMKAKLEQLTTGSGRDSSCSTSAATTPQQTPSSGIVSQAKSLLAIQEVSRLNEQRRQLLESQLGGVLQSAMTSGSEAGSTRADKYRDETKDFESNQPLVTGSKVLAAKQQLAAAAGVALAALDSSPNSQASSRRQSAYVVTTSTSTAATTTTTSENKQQSGNNEIQLDDLSRSSRVLQDELGPRSKAAISQRQAFYQMSASSDQISEKQIDENQTTMDSSTSGPIMEAQLNKESNDNNFPAPTETVSTNNLTLEQQTHKSQQGNNNLVRSMQISSNLNEAGQNVELDKERDPLYGHSIAKSMSQRQHENLMKNLMKKSQSTELNSNSAASAGGGGGNVSEQHQWISSSPDPTLESEGKKRSLSKKAKTNKQENEQPTRRAISSSASSGGNNQQQQRFYSQMSNGIIGKKIIQSHQATINDKTKGAGNRRKVINNDGSSKKKRICLTYADNVDWRIKIRKEFFMPSEAYDDPLVVQLIFAQLVNDVFNPNHSLTRLNHKERAALKAHMKDNSIGYSHSLPQIGQLQQVKRELIRMARSFGLYFTRLYEAKNFCLTTTEQEPDELKSKKEFNNNNNNNNKRHQRRRHSSQSNSRSNTSSSSDNDDDYGDDYTANAGATEEGKQQALKLMHRLRNANNLGTDWLDMVAVHHSGLRLVTIVPDGNAASGGYKVIESLKYRDMTDVSQVGNCELLVSMRNGKKCWLISSNEATQLGSLLRCFHADYNDHLNNNQQATSSAAKQQQSHQQQLNEQQKKRKHQLKQEHQEVPKEVATEEQERVSRKRANNKDALLASHDDHHGDHFKQRQTTDSVGKLHSSSNTNNDLANGKRILSNNLANIHEKDNKQQQQHQQQQQQHYIGGSQSSKQQQSDTLPTSTSAANLRKQQQQQQSTLPASSSPPTAANTTAASADRTSDGVFAPAQQRPSSASFSLEDLREQQLQQTEEATKQNQNKTENSDRKKEKSKNLWQNSLSRMSNKFSIFSGGGSSNSKNAKSNNANHQKQQDQMLPPIVTLDAWIETKVDFDDDDEDEDDNEADNVDQDGQQRSPQTTNTTTQKSEISPSENEEQTFSEITSAGSVKSKVSSKANNDRQQQVGNKLKASSSCGTQAAADDGKYSLLQFALYNFREAIDKYSLESRASKAQINPGDTSTLKGSLKLIETLRSSNNTNHQNNHQDHQQKNHHKRNSKSSFFSSINNNNSNNSNYNDNKHTSANNTNNVSSSSSSDWTWRELAEMVKFTKQPIKQSLLKLPSEDLNKRAVDCFLAIMQYMGDVPANIKQHLLQEGEVECVYLILMNCYNFPILRDEIYCQLIKQTTNNRSESNQDSCLKGWRLFSIIAAYFNCSQLFKPYLFKYLETAAYDKRRAYCSVALICLQNLRKTFKYNGRKNVPSIEEIIATGAGRNSKRQIYRLPGGTERIINTKSTTVVEDIIQEICANMLSVTDPDEMLEFSLYCIADGDLYTMPLNRDEYILDITTELIKNHQQYFLIFCRSIWHYPLRLDSKLYIEVIFNQIAPDYLEGLLLVLPNLRYSLNMSNNLTNSRPSSTTSSTMAAYPYLNQNEPLRLKTKMVKEIARIAALLHRASGTDYMPHKDEIKYLLPKPIITAMKHYQRNPTLINNTPLEDHNHNNRHSANSSSASSAGDYTTTNNNNTNNSLSVDTVVTSPQKWIELVQNNWREMSAFDTLDAKAQFLDIVRHWPLFGSSFFAIKLIQRDLIQPLDFILALNKLGIQMLDMLTHETVHKYPFNEVISTRKVRSEDGALFLDLKCGNLMKRTIIRIQTDQAHEISRLIRQYIDIELLQQKQQQQQPMISENQNKQQIMNTIDMNDMDDISCSGSGGGGNAILNGDMMTIAR